jgi:uncharacterized membrane protein YidH (DUF202 family)
VLLRELLQDQLPRSLAFWRAFAWTLLVLGTVMVLGGLILIVLEVRANLNGHSILPRRGSMRSRSITGLTGLGLCVVLGIAVVRVGWTELKGLKDAG